MSLFDIFGEHEASAHAERVGAVRVAPLPHMRRLHLTNNENFGKVFSSGSYTTPRKPSEPFKKSETKKSFLINKGTALQSTPLKLTPFGKGINNVNKKNQLKIYSDYEEVETKDEINDFEIELEFSKPTYDMDNFNRDFLDDIPVFNDNFDLTTLIEDVYSRTPEPVLDFEKRMVSAYSYEDDLFKDDISNNCIVVDDFTPPPID